MTPEELGKRLEAAKQAKNIEPTYLAQFQSVVVPLRDNANQPIVGLAFREDPKQGPVIFLMELEDAAAFANDILGMCEELKEERTIEETIQ